VFYMFVNFHCANIGLIFPEYVTSKTVCDLQAQKAAFDGRIVVIDAGAGVMIKTEQAKKHNALHYKIIARSLSAMKAE
ncbi:glycine betaine ABC transporter substrate-binding protein, partial [Glaciimonas sp. Cout2]|uniref:glycine betaine ABC transporter substrate-binding protein n=1 Tax=Glaciimonas sp. Cout2 TaxID=3048621 RepID=UPI002B226247